MGRLSRRTESHTSDKFSRDSSTEAPPEKRRRKKKTATIGNLTHRKFLFGSKSRETECVDWCVQTLTTTKKIWWVKTRPIGPQTETECSKSHGRKSKKCDQLMNDNVFEENWNVVLNFLNFRRSKVMESQLPDELDIEDDDVITDTPPPMPQHLALGPSQGQSQPSARFFVEKNSE